MGKKGNPEINRLSIQAHLLQAGTWNIIFQGYTQYCRKYIPIKEKQGKCGVVTPRVNQTKRFQIRNNPESERADNKKTP